MESAAIPAINVTGEPTVEASPEVEAEVVQDTSLPSETTDMIDGKFKSQDDLLAAYHALESKLGGGPDVSTPVSETPQAQSEAVPSDIVSEYASKIAESGGTITPEVYTELAAKGYSKDFVDTYVRGVQAQEVQAFESLTEGVGGVTAYNQAVEWAVNNFTPDQITNYNNALNHADENTAKILIGNLVMQAQAQVQPGQPLHTNNVTGKPANTGGYETKSEYAKDANDSRYEFDPAYRAKVEAKLAGTDMSSWYAALPRGI